MANFDQMMHWIQTYPWLFAATCGLILASSYLLLMLVTRLGDIKPGFQTFILSGLIHLVMATFWGTLAVPIGKPGGRGAKHDVTPIREVIVEVDGEASGNPEGTIGGEGGGPVWDALPRAQTDPFGRQNALADSAMPDVKTERTAGTIEPEARALPDLPRSVEVAVAAPKPQEMEKPAPRGAADQAVDIAEDTAESRPGVAVGNSAVGRSSAAPVGVAGEAVERDSGPGRPGAGNVALNLSAPPGPSTDLIGEEGPERQQTDTKVGMRQAGPAKSVVSIDEADGGEGTGTGGPGAGTPGSSKFTRSGSSAGRSDVAGTNVERQRTGTGTGTGVGINPARAPAMASLTPGGLRDGRPIGERPSIGRGPGTGAIANRGSAKLSDTYRLRNLPQRKRVAVQLGATQESERAVEISLRWLALHQNPEGYWDADGFDANCPTADRCWGKGGRGSSAETEKINNPTDRLALQTAGQQADTGLTALVLLTFLGAGYTHEEGEYSDQIDRSLRWLIRQQQPNGYLGGQASHYERMYCHGMATYALGEACGMMADADSDPLLRQALAKAVGYIVGMQNPVDGGWRYMDGKLAKQEGDMSMFGWQLMALKSAQIAGVEIPAESQAGMVRFLKRISLGEKRGLASYRFGEGPKASMTAEALFSRQMLGMRRDNPSSIEAVEYLAKHPPHQTEQDLYYWYYGTLAMYQYGGEPWRQWNDQLRDTLVATQRKTGHAAGSWDPRDNWSLHGGRLYSTALSTLCLEVYYRFLPLYQLNGSGLDDMEK